ERHAFEINRADSITDPFGNDEIDDNLARRRVEIANVFELKVDIAGIAIEFGEAFTVFFELLIFEDAGAGQPGKHPMPPRFELLAQFALGKGISAFEINIVD